MSALSSLMAFSINKDLQDLESDQNNSKFLFDGIVLQGQSTVIFSPPNSGKTLFLINQLHKAHFNNALNGLEVFYINADDSRTGLIEKTKLLNEINVHMLAPGYNKFEIQKFQSMVRKIISDNESHKVCFILDTIKKFSDTMDKKMMREFGILLSEFVSTGGTLIGLGHTNKNRSTNGELVYSGTTDLIEDCNCIYMLDVLNKHSLDESTEEKTLRLYNTKLRGDNLLELNFKYTKKVGSSYKDLVNSFVFISNEEFQAQEEERKSQESYRDFINNYNDAYKLIISFLSNKKNAEKGELRQHLQDNTDYGRDKCSSIISFLEEKLIRYELGGKTKRQKMYSLI
ncbi:hypothetical protein V4T84_000015 [Vibrio parahaemolyticus]|nr:hypothetical protein [Vibrio parahaemolyticus]HAS6940979.1 hypothetical protein [Vibrio parahaemolyticus]